MSSMTTSTGSKGNSTRTRGHRAAQEALPKGSKIYYRIGEVSRITGIKAYVLRYWESEFRWMAPAKSRSKQRLYRKKDIETILLIKRLPYEERFTIEGAKKRLKEMGRVADDGETALDAEVDSRTRVKRIRAQLEAIRDLL